MLGFVKNPRLMKVVERLARKHMEHQIDDPELLEKVTPDYTIGCKRILPSNRWYRALGKPNVELVTDGHQRGARALDRDRRRARARGRRDRLRHRLPRHRHPGRAPHPRPRRRAARRPLARQPARAPRQHGRRLPEPVLPARPEHRARAQLDGLHDRVPDRPRDGGAASTCATHGAETIEVRPEVQERYNAELERRLEGTVWNTGCASWYLDHTGRNVDRLARLDVALPAARRRSSTRPSTRSTCRASAAASSLREPR